MKETKLELDAKNMASLLGWIAYKGSGRTGAPDKIFIKANRVFTCEFKLPGEKQRPHQVSEGEILTANGTYYRVIDNINDFKTYLLEVERRFFKNEKNIKN